jgi:hypothetical protein
MIEKLYSITRIETKYYRKNYLFVHGDVIDGEFLVDPFGRFLSHPWRISVAKC